MTKNKPFIVIFIIILIVVFAITRKPDRNTYVSEEDNSNVVKISASFYPLAEFARQVGGENVKVTTITPGATEPHDFEPSPKDILKISSSDIFIFNGAKFDPWADELISLLDKKSVKTINMTRRLIPDAKDPHVWLDPILAKKSSEIIRDELKLIDPTNNDVYDINTKKYTDELLDLDERYKSGLKNCDLREAFTSHGAFGYIADRYNINIISISGVSPDKEPSVKELAEITKLAKLKNVEHVFSEPLASSKLAETVANEIKAELLELNPVESITKEQEERGENYISMMDDNLSNLRKALKCK